MPSDPVKPGALPTSGNSEKRETLMQRFHYACWKAYDEASGLAPRRAVGVQAYWEFVRVELGLIQLIAKDGPCRRLAARVLKRTRDQRNRQAVAVASFLMAVPNFAYLTPAERGLVRHLAVHAPALIDGARLPELNRAPIGPSEAVDEKVPNEPTSGRGRAIA
jgi:hypothetical protein